MKAESGQTKIYSAQETAALLPYPLLVEAVARACVEHEAGKITSPVRMGVPLQNQGVLLTMPASAPDIAVHKLVSMCPGNVAKGIPTIFGQVTVCDADTGQPQFILDGPTLTGRRTAAVSITGIKHLTSEPPRFVLVIGTGTQARYHVEALRDIFPNAHIAVLGQSLGEAEKFCAISDPTCNFVTALDGAIPEHIDTVITLTTSRTPVYTENAKAGRIIVGVGSFRPDAAEIDPSTVRASAVFVDDLSGAREEAGDLIQADVDWASVRSLASIVGSGRVIDRPVFLKCVGSGAWDLAACRVARRMLEENTSVSI